MERRCWDFFWEEFIHICLSSIMRHQFSASVTEEIVVWALGRLFLFTVCWWTVFVISLVKKTWGSCSQCRLVKYHLSKNQSSLGFTCILSAVICNFQGSQLIHFYFFSLQAALILRWYEILHMRFVQTWTVKFFRCVLTFFFLLKSNINSIQVCHVTIKCLLGKLSANSAQV